MLENMIIIFLCSTLHIKFLPSNESLISLQCYATN